MGVRERLANALYGAGALRAVMHMRRLAPIPSTIAILTYHHVAAEDDAYRFDRGVADATPEQFRRQMELVCRYATPIGIDELVRALDGAPLPKNPVMVTFDDGYRSCHDVALPILKSVGLPATFFIATSFISDRRIYWWDRIAHALFRTKVLYAKLAYPEELDLTTKDPSAMDKLVDFVKNMPSLDLPRMIAELEQALQVECSPDEEKRYAGELVMTWDHIRALAKAGMDVESHSRQHRVLQTLAPDVLREELEGSKRDLERELGRPVRALAYPVGRRIAHLAAIREAVAAAGYRVGFTNASGATRIWPSTLGRLMPTDRFDIHRLSTDRAMSDAMYFTQIAVPRLAYIGRHNA
jgi:peptidoglycan/xylan/chitin deacetylase (PgdA/CDA1 family)